MVIPNLKKIVFAALREDAAFHDITTQSLIPKNHRSKAILLAKQDLILCGMAILQQVFRTLDPRMKIRIRFKEGAKVRRGQVLAEISGRTRALLSGERVALNFLQHLSGIATLTRQFVDRVKGTKVKILDTRKTTPGLRFLEKYAVKVGGGVNHRFDLKSAVIIKDNHLAIAGSPAQSWKKIRRLKKRIPTILEVKNFLQLEEGLRQSVHYLQLDNMSLSQLTGAVKRVRGRCKLEATGGVNLRNVRRIAKTGVDFISVGAITHSAPAADISLEIADGKSAKSGWDKR